MLEKQQGRIFLVGSRPGLLAAAGKGMVAYGLAKYLLFRLAELMNDEARDTDVVTALLYQAQSTLHRTGSPCQTQILMRG